MFYCDYNTAWCLRCALYTYIKLSCYVSRTLSPNKYNVTSFSSQVFPFLGKKLHTGYFKFWHRVAVAKLKFCIDWFYYYFTVCSLMCKHFECTLIVLLNLIQENRPSENILVWMWASTLKMRVSGMAQPQKSREGLWNRAQPPEMGV